MRRLKYGSAVPDDFADISEYIATESGSRPQAEKFIRQLKARCATLAGLPGTLGRSRDELDPGLRSVAFKSYVIFFRYTENAMEIVTIVHGMRDIDTLFDDDSTPSSHP